MRVLNKGAVPEPREIILRIVKAARPGISGKLRVMKQSISLITMKYSHSMPTWALVWTKGVYETCGSRWAAIVQDPAMPSFFTLVLSSQFGGLINHGWQKRIHMPTGSRALMRFIDDARGHLAG